MRNKMRDAILYESFLLKTNTADNCNIIVGGFCPRGKKDETINKYLNLDNYNLDLSKDIYLIDYILANTIKKLSPRYVPVVGASILINGVKDITGGIIGNPFDQFESTVDSIEEIIKGMYLISFPGGPGTVFKGVYSDALMLREMILDYKIGKYRLDKIIVELDKISDLYVYVEDGCGLFSRGCIYVSDCYGKNYMTFK